MSFVIHQGDALAVLRALPEASVSCCITSPPYWGLRDYGTATWEGGSADCDHIQRHGLQGSTGQRADRTYTGKIPYKGECGKCGALRLDDQIGLESTPDEYICKLVGLFSEVRRLLTRAGTLWLNLGDSYASGGRDGHGTRLGFKQSSNRGANDDTSPVRAPQPEGLKPKDLVGIPWRVALALQANGWYLRSDIIWHKPNPMPESVTDRPTKAHEYLFLLAKSERYYYDAGAIREPHSEDSIARALRARSGGKFIGQSRAEQSPLSRGAGYGGDDPGRVCSPGGRNKRSVWTLATLPTPEAHFATFPIELPETCMRAGCPEDGTVLDPFAGAGTTGLACLKNARNFVGIELNPAYIEIAHARARKYYPLLMDVPA